MKGVLARVLIRIRNHEIPPAPTGADVPSYLLAGGKVFDAPKAAPSLSAVAFKCKAFLPDKFHEGLGPGTVVQCEWVNRDARLHIFVTRSEPQVQWSNAKALRERVWDGQRPPPGCLQPVKV